MAYSEVIPSPRERRAGRGVPFLLTRCLSNVGKVSPLPIPSSWREGEARLQFALWQLVLSMLRIWR